MPTTYGLGKLRVFKKLNDSTGKNIMDIADSADVNLNSVIEMREKKFMRLYGKFASEANLLIDLQGSIYILPRYIPISTIPPTSSAYYFHMLQTNLE